MPWRIVSWASSFVTVLLAFTYLPTWRECLVFMVAMTVANVCNMRIGQLLGGGQ